MFSGALPLSVVRYFARTAHLQEETTKVMRDRTTLNNQVCVMRGKGPGMMVRKTGQHLVLGNVQASSGPHSVLA